ncbi:MAG: DUF2142 domain-containing protein [Candidatus Aminicenantes bacterium]|nr:DUF2142 domain-containing protein [Candidatus Aminicenantes bacterium]
MEIEVRRNKVVRVGNKLFLVLIIFFLGAVFIILNYAIPPFQNPDEPMHFYAIMASLKGEDKASEIEKEIINFMDKHNWWRFLGLGRPTVLPSRLNEISFLTQNYPLPDIRARLNNLVFYHKMASTGLKVIGGESFSLKRVYFILRFVSAFFALLSLFLIYFVWKKINPLVLKKINFFIDSDFFLNIIPVLLVAFIPQFLIISIAVSPDAFCLFLGSVFFASAFHLALGLRPWVNLILMVLISLIGFFTDRSLFFLLVMLLLCLPLGLRRADFKRSIVMAIGSIFLIMVVIYVSVLIFPLLMENSFNLLRTATQSGLAAVKQLFSFEPFSRQFILQLVDSFLICFGWMSFKVGSLAYWIWRLIILIVAASLFLFAIKRIIKLKSDFKINLVLLKIVFISITGLMVQVIGIFAYYGRVGSLPQGRYLFPAILPLALLLVIGLGNFFSLFWKRTAIVGFSLILMVEFFFLNYVLLAQIIPVFHLMIKSPYPGF